MITLRKMLKICLVIAIIVFLIGLIMSIIDWNISNILIYCLGIILCLFCNFLLNNSGIYIF